MTNLQFTDDEVFAALRRFGGRTMTYVVRNVLDAEHNKRGLTTDAVLRRLKKMEQAGKVYRSKSSYRRQICWAIVP